MDKDALYGDRCMDCGSDSNLELHRIEESDSYTEENTCTLCRKCHCIRHGNFGVVLDAAGRLPDREYRWLKRHHTELLRWAERVVEHPDYEDLGDTSLILDGLVYRGKTKEFLDAVERREMA